MDISNEHVLPMTTYFVTRHAGAIEWARASGIAVDRQLAHLDMAEVKAGDCVIGTLPVHLAAEVCALGARYFHLALEIPPEWRGRELSAEDLRRFGARIVEYRVVEAGGKLP
jgi:CRISPR-associated protein Csx16